MVDTAGPKAGLIAAARDRAHRTGHQCRKRAFQLPLLARYRYELAVGGEPISEQEWRTLVEAKSELVRFRGQWMEIKRDDMARILDFWQRQGDPPREMPLTEPLQKAASAEEENFELTFDGSLEQMMVSLRDASQLRLCETPWTFQGTLRGYQQRGLA